MITIHVLERLLSNSSIPCAATMVLLHFSNCMGNSLLHMMQ